MKWFNYIFKNIEPPLWLRRLNYISLAGVIAWPLVFFASIFMFDDPNGDTNTRMIWWVVINCYPPYLLLLTFLSFKLYHRSPIIAAILPCIPLAAYATLVILIAFS